MIKSAKIFKFQVFQIENADVREVANEMFKICNNNLQLFFSGETRISEVPEQDLPTNFPKSIFKNLVKIGSIERKMDGKIIGQSVF